MTATCRVLDDHSLLCRDAVPDLANLPSPVPSWREPALDGRFAHATIHALANMRVRPQLRAGGDSVGREARMSISWTLPED